MSDTTMDHPNTHDCPKCGHPMAWKYLKAPVCSQCHPELLPAGYPSQTAPAVPDEDTVTAMVNAFLAWDLPENFCPDGGISFDKPAPEHAGWWPAGTNLFDFDQATAMVRHMLAAAPQAGHHRKADPETEAAIREAASDGRIVDGREPDHSPDAGKVVQVSPAGWIWDAYGSRHFTYGCHHKEVLEADGLTLTPVYTHPDPAADGVEVEPVGIACVGYGETVGQPGFTQYVKVKNLIPEGTELFTHPAQPRNEVQAEALPVRYYAISSEDEDLFEPDGDALGSAMEKLAELEARHPDTSWDLIAVIDATRLRSNGGDDSEEETHA